MHTEKHAEEKTAKEKKKRKMFCHPSEITIFPTRMRFNAPNKEGQNFIQNMLLPKCWVSHANTESKGGTSIYPKAMWLPSAR